MTLVFEERGLVHEAKRGTLSWVSGMEGRPALSDALLTYWYQPRGKAEDLVGAGEYHLLSTVRAMPADPGQPAWQGRVLAFLRRYRDGLELSSNWGMERFRRSRRLAAPDDAALGVAIRVGRGKVEARIEIGVEREPPMTMAVAIPGQIELHGVIELRLGNPGDGRDPGENDRDRHSVAEPGARWWGMRFELLARGEEARGLLDPPWLDPVPDPDLPRRDAMSSQLVLAAAALGDWVPPGDTPEDVGRNASRAARAAYEALRRGP